MVIGFTVGVWDLFHEGHYNFLKEAKTHCDYLHVGVMNDFWCHIQKGHDRPYESLQKRIVNLRVNGLADNIVILDTLDMTHYLQMVDVWIKGVDQKNMRPFDFANCKFVGRTPNVSTTGKIKSLRTEYHNEIDRI